MNPLLVAWRVSNVLPVSFTRAIAAAVGWWAWLTRAKPVRRLEENLSALDIEDERELRRLSRRGMASAARYYAEVFELQRMTPEQFDYRVRMVNAEGALDAIAREGRFVAALTHSGNWDLVGAHACRNVARVTSVAEILKPVEVFNKFVEAREAVGMQILGHEGSGTFRRLVGIGKSEGGVLALVADRDLSGSGVVVDWFERKAKVAPGPAALAIAVGCGLIPIGVHYERLHGARRRAAKSRWGIVMEFGPRIDPPEEGTNDQKVLSMSQAWASWISSHIARHPEDWHMLQRFGWVNE